MNSMHKRMPRSKSWASPGGIAPTEQGNNLETNNDHFNEESRPGTRGGNETEASSKEGERQAKGGGPDEGQQQREEQDHHLHHQHQTEVGEQSCLDSRHKRMPRSKSWASPGGIAPIEQERGLSMIIP